MKEAVVFTTITGGMTLPVFSIELLGLRATLVLGIIALAILATLHRSTIPRARCLR
jgi:hypothetical protein